MIVEQRDYHVFTGKLPEVVRLYDRGGHRDPAGAPRRASSARSRRHRRRSRPYTHLWGYDSFAEREQRRARLQADERWKEFLAQLQPLIHTQQNRILRPDRRSRRSR